MFFTFEYLTQRANNYISIAFQTHACSLNNKTAGLVLLGILCVLRLVCWVFFVFLFVSYRKHIYLLQSVMLISAAGSKLVVSIFSVFFSNFQAAAHLPYEFTVTGMLERLNAYIEYQVCIVHFHFKVFKKSLTSFFQFVCFPSC